MEKSEDEAEEDDDEEENEDDEEDGDEKIEENAENAKIFQSDLRIEKKESISNKENENKEESSIQKSGIIDTESESENESESELESEIESRNEKERFELATDNIKNNDEKVKKNKKFGMKKNIDMNPDSDDEDDDGHSNDNEGFGEDNEREGNNYEYNENRSIDSKSKTLDFEKKIQMNENENDDKKEFKIKTENENEGNEESSYYSDEGNLDQDSLDQILDLDILDNSDVDTYISDYRKRVDSVLTELLNDLKKQKIINKSVKHKVTNELGEKKNDGKKKFNILQEKKVETGKKIVLLKEIKSAFPQKKVEKNEKKKLNKISIMKDFDLKNLSSKIIFENLLKHKSIFLCLFLAAIIHHTIISGLFK